MLKAGRSFKIKVFCSQTRNTCAWVKCPFQLVCHENQRICSFLPPRLLSNDIKFGGLNFFSYILSCLFPISAQYTLLSCSSAALPSFLPFSSLLPPFYSSVQALPAIPLKVLHVHRILSRYFPLLFCSFCSVQCSFFVSRTTAHRFFCTLLNQQDFWFS